jgi:predicted lactoylglutathione lyase
MEFFRKLGFEFDPRFTDEKAACMVVSQEAFVMLLSEPFFKTFTKNDVCDTSRQTEGMFALSCRGRAEVDETVERAIGEGSTPWTRSTTVSCTAGASTTSTGTAGRSSGWIRTRSRSRRENPGPPRRPPPYYFRRRARGGERAGHRVRVRGRPAAVSGIDSID